MLFRGHSYRNLDPKGRLLLPPDFRDILMEGSADGRFVLTIYDGCVVGYPTPEWVRFEEKFSRLRGASRKVRDFRRMVLGGAEEIELDPQGRVRIPRAQMEYACLDHDVVVVGQGNHFEIWSQEAFKNLLDQNFDDVADELAESGLDFSL